MARCRCAGNACTCGVVAGPGITVEGAGSLSDPFVVSADPPTDFRWLPAGRFLAAQGGPTLTAFGGASSNFAAWLLDQTAVEGINANEYVPDHWLTFDVELWFTNQGAGAGNVVFVLNSYQAVNGGSMLTLDTTTAIGAISAPTIAIMKVITAASDLPNLGGDRAFYLQRTANDVADTLANDIAIVGLRLVRTS